jgi:two-component system phosphate regulon sensor histidine kinase PhoR
MGTKEYLYDLFVHDLAGPLSVAATTARGLLSRMEAYGPLTEQQKQCLERIERNTKKAQVILKEILDVGRSEEHLFQANEFFVQALVKDALLNVMEILDASVAERLENLQDPEAAWNILREQGVFVRITGKYSVSPFFHDRRKVQLILENLMSNALKYRKTKLDVSISGETDLVILVSDDGCGIPKNEQEIMYKRFMQLKHEELRQAQGFGLGLFCVKALVESMGGEIAVMSGEDCGTTFTVRISPLHAR